MPSARLFSRTASRRLLLPALTIALAAVLASLAATETGSACSAGPPPKPLRALYAESDLVVVARVGQTVPVEVLAVDEKGTRIHQLKTSLHVSSTVKGQGNHGVIPVYSWRWQMKGDDEPPHAFGEYAESDKLLLFLKRRPDGEGYAEADSSYGVKKLSDADLRVYIERMDELALIQQQEKPDPARIVEWLVRCAEEPATRWEGLYELSTSKYAADANKAEKEAEAEEGAGEEGGEAAAGEGEGEDDRASLNHGEASAEGAVEAGASPGEGDAASNADSQPILLTMIETVYVPDPELVGLLTAEQKKRLADALFKVEEMTDADMTLVEMVKEWRDPRFVPFALAQLRGFGDDPPYMAEALMAALAETLGNEELKKIAEKYSENSSYYDEEVEAADEGDEAGEAAGDATTAEAVNVTSEEESAEEDEEDPVEKAFEESLVGDSAQKRKLRLQRFIARAEVALAN